MFSIEYLRQFKIGEYAIFDIAISFLGIYILSPLLSNLFLKFKIVIPKTNWIYLTLPLSVVIHLLVRKVTPMTANFIDPHGNYILKLFILVLFILGIKGIKKI